MVNEPGRFGSRAAEDVAAPDPAPRRRVRPARAHRRRHVPGISVLPTLFTLGNLVAGFAAIHYAARPIDYEGPWGWTGLTLAGILIFVGMFFDGVDGSIARLTRSSSTIGAQLDSLCDMLTFGVAPAFMALRLVIGHFEETAGSFATSSGLEPWVIGPEADSVLGKIVWAIAAVYVCCACMRLARFNVESGLSQVNDHRLFRGLPTPGAAGAVASLVILHQHYLVVKFGGELPHELVRWTTLVIPAVMALCALAMVSSIPYLHFANNYLRGHKSFGFIVRLVVILVLMIWFLQEILAIAFLTYALSGPVRLGWRWMQRGRQQPSSA